MKVEFYGFERLKYFHKLWYLGFTGIKIFGKRFIGFTIKNDRVVIQMQPKIISKPSVGVWIYILFYNIYVEFKNPWKGTKYE